MRPHEPWFLTVERREVGFGSMKHPAVIIMITTVAWSEAVRQQEAWFRTTGRWWLGPMVGLTWWWICWRRWRGCRLWSRGWPRRCRPTCRASAASSPLSTSRRWSSSRGSNPPSTTSTPPSEVCIHRWGNLHPWFLLCVWDGGVVLLVHGQQGFKSLNNYNSLHVSVGIWRPLADGIYSAVAFCG